MALNFMNNILSFKKIGGYDTENSEEVPETPASCVSMESLPVAEKPVKMQVSIRIRPNLQPSRNKKTFDDLFVVDNPTTLLVKHFSPNEAARFSKSSKSNDSQNKKKYTFTRIFDSGTDQLQFFNESIKPTLVDFLNNRSSTIISYGTMDSGKTYTLFGSPQDPGVIPRTIEFIYSSINCTLSPWYKPKKFCNVVDLTEYDRSLEIATMEKLLSCRLVDNAACEESYDKLESSKPSSNQEIFKDSMYSVWISFVEIYNDTIFDLLEVDEDGKNMQLKLAVDINGFTYIQDMRSVCATTGLEAYEILQAGQSRLSTVSTENYKSSRSHSIFTLKLLKYDKELSPFEVQVTSLSFFDLAGTGKIQKAIKDNKELKETRSINTSLLALGRCFKFVAHGHPRRSIGPFRDSKLTRLVQHSLCGHENILLLVNINPTLELYAETQSVLNFATTAMKLSSSREDKKLAYVSSPISDSKIQETRSEIIMTPQQQEYEDLIYRNKQLEIQLHNIKSMKWKNEYDIRKELMNLHTKQMNDLETSWKKKMLAMKDENDNLIQFTVNKVKNFYKEKLEECSNRKRKRSDRGDFEDKFDPDLFESDSLTKILSTKKSLENIRNENKDLMTKKNQNAFELSLLKKCLKQLAESVSTSCPEELESLDLLQNGTKVLDEEVVKNFSILQKLILKAKREKRTFKKVKAGVTQEVQCNSFTSIISEFCQELENIIENRSVCLPEINDSLDSAPENHNLSSDCTNHLLKLKDLVADTISKMTNIQTENFEKNEEIVNLKSVISKQEQEILQLKDKCQELKYDKLSLSKKLEDLTLKSNIKDALKNFESITIESEHIEEQESLNQAFISNNLSGDDYHLSLEKIDCLKSEKRERDYSSGSSRGNDSGLTSSIEFSSIKETKEKCSQTFIPYNEDELLQLKLDYETIKAKHSEEFQRVSELSQELNCVKEAMTSLKMHSGLKEKIIVEYKNELSVFRSEVELLRHQKQLLEIKCSELNQKILNDQKVYENKLKEAKTKVDELSGVCMNDCNQKTIGLRSELSIAYSQIEKTSIRCFKEHVLRIEELEKELKHTKSSEANLEEKVIKYERDLIELNDLADKVCGFENSIVKMQNEKEDLRKLMTDQFKIQCEIEEKVKDLNDKIGQRDDEIESLKFELDTLTCSNQSNTLKAKQFGKEINDLLENTNIMKEEIKKTEETWKDLELTSEQEINKLRSRVSAFEENNEILNCLRNDHNSQKNEVEMLKTRLSDKESELEFYKKNRNATIQRYECLVKQLQGALKASNNSSRLRRIFPYKQKYFFSGVKEISDESEPLDSKLPDEYYALALPCTEPCTSQTSQSRKSHAYSEKLNNSFRDEEDSAFLIASCRKKHSETEKKSRSKKSTRTSLEQEESEEAAVLSKCLQHPSKPEASQIDRKSKKTKSFFLHRRKSSRT